MVAAVKREIDFPAHIESVVKRLRGEPNWRKGHELFYGNKGSLVINLKKGVWYDHENKVGGGTLDIIKQETGRAGFEAVQWMEDEGILPHDPTSNRPAHSLSAAAAPKPKQEQQQSAEYDYVDENGALLHQVLRPGFLQRRRDGRGDWIYKLDGVRRVLYRLPELIAGVAADRVIHICEGEKDVDNLRELGLVASTNPGGAGNWLPEYSEFLRGAHVVIFRDNDDAGDKHVQIVGAALTGIAKQIQVFDIAKHWPDCPGKGDVSDWLDAGGNPEDLNAWIAEAPEFEQKARISGPHEWGEPKPLPNGLPGVEPFSLEFLPDRLSPWVGDITKRLGCPPDFVAVAAMTALGAVIGRRVGVKPQEKTDWMEHPNIWGMFIGRPGLLKSPAMSEALKPIHYLEAEVIKNNDTARKAYEIAIDDYKLRQGVKASLTKDAMKKCKTGEKVDINFNLGDEPVEPLPVRYRTNDSSYEAVGELLIANPSGILVERDELVSLLAHLDSEEQTNARGFYLSGWSGTQPFTFDRIIRGHRHIDGVCISVLGNTQPSRLAGYVKRANADGAGGDGLLQRFGLMVWPDAPAEGKNVDEWPDSEARKAAGDVFERASKLTPNEALRLGAAQGAYDKVPSFRFDADAQAEFLPWRTELERRLRDGSLSPALEAHLAKYRKMVPALALINHIADGGDGNISRVALLKALAFADYLESHARRIYGASSTVELGAAKAIHERIRKKDLTDGFSARDVHQRDWSHLTDRDHVQLGLDLLCDLDYLTAVNVPSGIKGGRPKTTYAINPRALS